MVCFQVLLHESEEFADVSQRGFVIGPGSETFVSVRATSMHSTDRVASKVSFEQRRCHVPGERQLKYFSHYSQTACVVECATNRMLELCHCRPFFFRGSRNTISELVAVLLIVCLNQPLEGLACAIWTSSTA